MIEHMTLPEIIVRRARDYGWNTQDELAKALGLSAHQVRNILSGRYKVGIKAARALVRALDLAPEVVGAGRDDTKYERS